MSAIINSGQRNSVPIRLVRHPRLKADLQPPEFDFRFPPNTGHSQAHAGLPLVTQAVWKQFFGGQDEILIREVSLNRNYDSPA